MDWCVIVGDGGTSIRRWRVMLSPGWVARLRFVIIASETSEIVSVIVQLQYTEETYFGLAFSISTQHLGLAVGIEVDAGKTAHSRLMNRDWGSRHRGLRVAACQLQQHLELKQTDYWHDKDLILSRQRVSCERPPHSSPGQKSMA
jgi:hypothetical protein